MKQALKQHRTRINLTLFLLMSLGLLIFLPSRVEASDPVKAEMYMGDYEIRKNKVGSSFVYEEVKYLETGSAKVIKRRTTTNNTWVSSYYHTNHQGSTIVVTANNGRVDTEYSRGRLRYFPYGEQITSHNINTQVVADTYTGQKKDTESDLMFYNARLYNQNTGLFMQADSVNDGLNRYAYVSGNPVNNFDISGKTCVGSDCEDISKMLLRLAEEIWGKNSDKYAEHNDGHYDVYPEGRVDPTLSQVYAIMQDVSAVTGIDVNIWMSIGFRENLLNGEMPYLHGENDFNSGDGLMAVAFLYHNTNPDISMGNPNGTEGWNSNFVMHHGSLNDTDYETNIPIVGGRQDAEVNIYLGAAVFMHSMSLLDDPNYSNYVGSMRDTGYSDYSIAYGLYNKGIFSLRNDSASLQSSIEQAGRVSDSFANSGPVYKFETTIKNRSWQLNQFCPNISSGQDGWCGINGPRIKPTKSNNSTTVSNPRDRNK